MGVAVRWPNNGTLRRGRCHVPLYFGICAQGPLSIERNRRGDLIPKSKQRECGAFPPILGARPALPLPPVPTGRLASCGKGEGPEIIFRGQFLPRWPAAV
jgi:hypothetical protein